MNRDLASILVFSIIICLNINCGDSNPSGGGPADDPLTSLSLIDGIWWTETQNDTIVHVTDSSGITKTTDEQLQRSHKMITSIDDGPGGELYYIIESIDTMIDPDNGNVIDVSSNTLALRLMNSKLEYYITLGVPGLDDSIAVTFLTFPLTIGTSWQTASMSLDTTIYYPVSAFGFNLNIKLYAEGSMTGNANVAGKTDYQFGGEANECYIINSTLNGDATAIVDTTITLFFEQGDTALNAMNRNTSQQYFSKSFTLPLRTYTVDATFDTNYVFGVSHRDTTRSLSRMTSYYDPRTGAILTE